MTGHSIFSQNNGKNYFYDQAYALQFMTTLETEAKGDKFTDKILGAHMIGHEAGTVIHELSIAMGFGASSEDVARICHGHPTVNEAIKEAALATYSKAIHF